MANWKQFQANGANQGFIPISTGPASSFKWKADVGPVSFGSPVIGNDGNIYIGNLLAELVSIAPNGTVRWKRTLDQRGSTIPASPAIDENGNIYAVTTFQAKVRDHRAGETVYKRVAHSKLHSLTPDGNLRWSFSFPQSENPSITDGYSLSSPKILGKQNSLIFIPAVFTKIASRIEILVIDQAGNLVYRTQVADYPTPPVSTGNNVLEILNSIWDFLNGMEFNPSGGPPLEKQFGRPVPTLALADFGNHASQPIIIIDDNYMKLAAFHWSNQQLIPLWEKKSSQVRQGTTPAILLSGIVASGQTNGTLALYDVLTGQDLWQPWYKAPNSLVSPVASFVSQIYLSSLLHLTELDANAKFLNRVSFDMTSLSAPAISADRVFVNGGNGYYTFSLDLKELTKNNDFQGGLSSPAIANDGTVYVMDRNKMLWAFGKEQIMRPRKKMLTGGKNRNLG